MNEEADPASILPGMAMKVDEKAKPHNQEVTYIRRKSKVDLKSLRDYLA